MKSVTKRFALSLIICLIIAFLGIAMVNIVIDPFLHFHQPLSTLAYQLKDARYINDGISRNYEYDAIITGSSTSQNFRATEVDGLWDVDSVKLTYSGGSYYEIGNGLDRALRRREGVKTVIWGLDMTRINAPADYEEYDDIPKYLYNDNYLDDVYYLLNMDVLRQSVAVVNYTRAGGTTTTMDDYSAWRQWASYGRELVLSGLIDYSAYGDEVVLTEEDRELIRANITKNIIEVVRNNPDTEFVFYFTPSSAAYWYGMLHGHQMNAHIESVKIAAELLLGEPNVQLYDYAYRTDITCNLDNYMDTLHYSDDVSSELLRLMATGEGRLNIENYGRYYDDIRELYSNYEYDY